MDVLQVQEDRLRTLQNILNVNLDEALVSLIDSRKRLKESPEETELAMLKAREKACATMDEAEKIALMRGLQECCEALGLHALSSPADLVLAVRLQCTALNTQIAEIAQEWHTLRIAENDLEIVRGTIEKECEKLNKARAGLTVEREVIKKQKAALCDLRDKFNAITY